MRYRSRLLLAILVSVALIDGLSLAVMYHLASRALFEEIGNNALSVASVTAAFVDAEAHKSIRQPGDEKTEAYRRLRETLKRARDASRREDTHVANLYTMKPLAEDPNVLAYGVDSEESARHRSGVDQALMVDGRQPVLEREGVDRANFSSDQYGTWLSANAPVRDAAGNVVAAVGVDVPADFVRSKLDRLKLAALASFALTLALGTVVAVVYSARASRPVRAIHRTLESVRKGDLTARVGGGCAGEFADIADEINTMTEDLRKHEAVKSAFVSYVSTQALDRVLETGAAPVVEADRRRITVLFSDIREFTGTSENMRPEEVVEMLNEYFEKMVDVVVRHKGAVDKFIGDGLMAIFGAPEEDSFQEEHAVYAALEMQREMRKLREKWTAEGRPALRIGVGINSGNAIVGNIGSAQRLEYTAIGDTVNLASRLESATKEWGVEVLISQHTFDGIKGTPLVITRKGETSVKGRDEKVMVYAIDAPDAAPLPQPQVTV